MATTGALGKWWSAFVAFFRQDMTQGLVGDLQLAREIARRIGEDEPDEGAPSIIYVIMYLDDVPLLQARRAFESAEMSATLCGPDEWHVEIPVPALRRKRLAQVFAMSEVLRARGWRTEVVS